jgi:tyrosyl-tRNA synthetase
MSETKFKSVEEQLAYLKKGTAEIVPEDELKAKLANSLKTGNPLRVYLGVDPTAPDLHLGHTVVLRKLKHFQDLGHTAVFLIGDFSAMIGDPTGVSETRPSLTREQVDANAKTYLDQVFKILDRDKTEVRYNSEWLGKMSAGDVVRLSSHYRLARMLEREDFRSRLEKGHPISVHELLYPLLTAFDAVSLKSDVELGATEQKFNLLVHREIQREYGLPGQAILTMPILVGLDGQRKMSKSFGNYIGITEAPNEIFGKIMSIPDDLMWTYFELLTDRGSDMIENLRRNVKAGTTHPKQVKVSLASEVVRDFCGEEAAIEAAQHFQRVFSERQVPEQMREIKFYGRVGEVIQAIEKKGVIDELTHHSISVTGKQKWSKFLVTWAGLESNSAAERLIKQRGLEVNGQIVANPAAEIDFTTSGALTIRAGKKTFLRLVIE